MYMGQNPPSPKHTPAEVDEHLVKTQLLERNYLEDLAAVIEFRKKTEHKEIKDISGVELDEFIQKSKQFVSRMEQLLLQLQKKKKETIVQKNYEVMIKAAVAALKKMEKLPDDPKDLPQAVKAYLIDKGHVDPYFSEVFGKVVMMRKMLDEDKTGEIPQRDLELTREYVRRFVRDLEPLLEAKTGPQKGRKMKRK